jgi:very-short-patch-repair endonuclease
MLEKKKCNKCSRELPLDSIHFIKDKYMKDGFKNSCKECLGHKFKEIQRGWTKEQDKYLIKNYATTPSDELVKVLNKKSPTIRARAIKFGLKKQGWFWTDEEINIIKKYYPKMTIMDLQEKYLPNKSLDAIANKSFDLELKKDEYFIENVKIPISIKNVSVNHGLKGEDSPLYVERIVTHCDMCNKELKLTNYKYENCKNHFCSLKCRSKWRSIHESGINSPYYGIDLTTEEFKKLQAKRVVERLSKSDFSYSRTKPQKIIDKLLDDLNIEYDNEYDCKYYLIDNYLKDDNLMIEVQGNFFHCNPSMKNAKTNSRREKIITKDKCKHTYIKDKYNIEILYLWEEDIYKNIELCKELILKYISNKGVLLNYSSFNYSLINNEIIMNDKLYSLGY